MSKEVKIGLLALIAILSAVMGYRFVKGENLLSSSKEVHAIFEDVTGLTVSSDVTLNGYKVGSVTGINLDPANVKAMKVMVRIDGDIPVPKNARLELMSDGIVGGKFLALSFDGTCAGADCAQTGDQLLSGNVGLIGSMLGGDDVGSIVGDAAGEITKVLQGIGAEGSEDRISKVVIGLDASLQNIAKLTASLDRLTRANSKSMQQTFANLEQITGNLAASNAQITSMLGNLDITTQKLSQVDIAKTMTNADQMLANSSATVEQLQTTLKETTEAIEQFGEVAAKFNEGDGSLSRLLNDKQLYDNLASTSNNLSLLLQDMRLNPKRYVHLSVFGKKNKKYTNPEDDPAQKK